MAKDKAYMAQYRAMRGDSVSNSAEYVSGDPNNGFASQADFEMFAKAWADDWKRFRNPDTRDWERTAIAFDASLDAGDGFGGAIFRGITVDDSILAGFEPGAVIDQKGTAKIGIASWSKAKSVAEDFAYRNYTWEGGNPVVFVMEGGTRHGRDISKLNRRRREKEVTTSSKSRQRIVRVVEPEAKGYATFVYVEEV